MHNEYENARPADTFGHGQRNGQGVEAERTSALLTTADYTNPSAETLAGSVPAGQSGEMLAVALDTVYYKSKPDGPEFGAITRRLQQAGPAFCTPAEFCEHVRRGGSWVGAIYEPCDRGWGSFKGQQLFGLDFDNGTGRNGSKAPLAAGEVGFLDPVDALDRCEELGLKPLCLYFTMSAQCPAWPRFRLVFDAEELVDEDMAGAYIGVLLAKFPEADQACKNPNRVWLGSQGEVWECWKAWGGCNG